MKKSIICIMVLLFVLVGGVAFANEGMENEGVEMQAGVKMWYNQWKSEEPGANSMTFDSSLLIGPSFEAEFPNHVFVEASIMFSAMDYEWNQAPEKITADRQDIDIAVGYQFIPEAGAFVGYKNSSSDWTYTDGVSSSTGSIDLSGPVIGLRGNVAINEMFSAYASAAYLMTKVENKEAGAPTEKEDAPGTVFELGVKAAFNEALSGTLGYKIESTKEDKTNIKDTFSGVTLGVMYAF